MSHTLAQLAAEYARIRQEEMDLAAIRRDLAAQIQALTGHQSEGWKTYDADGWKVTVKAPLIRSMDWQAWEQIKGDIPADLWPVETKTVLDEKGVKWIQANDPQTFAVLSQALTTKPGAISVTVSKKEN